MAIELKITANEAADLWKQMMDLAEVPEFFYRPWENKEKMEEIMPKAEQTIEPDTQHYETPVNAPLEGTEVKTQPRKTEEIGLQELKKKCAEIGDKFGREVFQDLKATAGFESMAALDGPGRTGFAKMLDDYLATH